MTQSRVLATSLFADIVGYTDLMQRDEASAMEKLDQFKSSLEREIPKHGGEIIQYFGDGCLALFSSAFEAISCARKLQQQWGLVDKLPVRIGVHLGDVIRKDDNVYGDSVNVASRIESMGIPNSILLSDSIRNSIKNHPELRFQLLGNFEFKNVSEPIAVYALDTDHLEIPDPASVTGKLAVKAKKRSTRLRRFGIVALIIVAILAYDYFEENSKSKETKEIASSIAVLPFTNLSQDTDQDYLTAGFTSEVNHQLSKIESLSVVSQTITQQLVSQQKSSPEIAEELDVNYILEGTIKSAGERTRLITNLTRMTDNKLIWSEEFDLSEINLIDAQIQVSTG
ncbi:MAG: adenylate/guanylate cyclase domain-containing protein, partial [Bacteroidia bacterium]|nr:adenylate/guanylate cyclase domain-containing protein [Bacteroidia bacterium]